MSNNLDPETSTSSNPSPDSEHSDDVEANPEESTDEPTSEPTDEAVSEAGAAREAMGEVRSAVLDNKKKVSVARARLERLFDDGTMEELGSNVVHRVNDFGLEDKKIPGDGVITACGEVDGRPVYAFAQDRTVLGGSLGQAHAKKITRLQDLALNAGAPLVAINDSGGARIQEGVDALGGYGEIFRRNVAASGVIPQISAIMGPCAGGAVYSPSLTDFVGMVDGSSFMFLTGPKVVKTVTFEDVSVEELGGAVTHGDETGVSQFIWDDDEEGIECIQNLLGYMPSNNRETPPFQEPGDELDRMDPDFHDIVPEDTSAPYDARRVIDLIVDEGSFFEVHRDWAENIVVGFGRLGGHVVGIVANQPDKLAGVLDIDASRKGARFIRTCNAFNIPLISLVDVPGFLPGTDQEHGGVIDHGAKLLYAYCEATVPKLSVVLRKAYGGAYIVMSSKHVGGDINLAWPSAEIAVMGAKGAVEILNRREIQAADDPEAKKEELKQAYEEKFLNPDHAAKRGYLDAVIEPHATRRKLHRHLKILLNKREWMPPKKNGNIPV
jgi:acetyl-CoA/propionyl-CoA carboxylase carboxyl transferase subunit